MSAASILMSEDLFLCPICLDVFKDPVSTPCGHNFCKKCLTEHWKIRGRCLCPTCKAPYKTRPDLKVNTFISEMITLLIVSKPGDVPCDICMRTNRKALKSCLVCQVSYCETHLEPHVRVKGLKRHQLMEPVENLEERMCARHGKFLERFCLTDQTPVCRFCSVLDHRTHKSVPLKAYEEKKTEIGKIDAEIQQKQLTIQDFKDSVKLRKANGDREVARCLQVSTSLLEHIERGTADIIKMMGEKQRTENQVIQDLEQEMSKLMKRKMEVEQFSLSVDNHLQSKNIDRPLPIKDWSKITIPPGGDYSGSLVLADVDSQHKEKALQ